jgi:hypothetical protein
MDRYTQQLVNELRDASRDKVPMSVELCGQSAVRLERLAREVEELKEKLAERSWAGAGLIKQRQWLSRSAQATQTNGTETVFSKNQLTKTPPDSILYIH